LLEALLEVGIYELGWQEIKAWSDLTGSIPTPWESTSMITLSKIYTKAINDHDGKDTASPWHDGIVDREAIDKSIRATLRGK